MSAISGYVGPVPLRALVESCNFDSPAGEPGIP